ncbi:phosphate transporter, putative [Eimeria tenella]|uniref:Phosphate transporter, putative n=1 Tax=Eimeria tenella TaxID=5802 RepID=U6L793_EIMTE|nr:phosphate transporter, putative [Eimeria tenella]CDJ45078.1 phosphate transporter, putative [Eimeria tenella]|eukprot:XP_013235825.1 phosphate transporter, putative [Eimeria tenella]
MKNPFEVNTTCEQLTGPTALSPALDTVGAAEAAEAAAAEAAGESEAAAAAPAAAAKKPRLQQRLKNAWRRMPWFRDLHSEARQELEASARGAGIVRGGAASGDGSAAAAAAAAEAGPEESCFEAFCEETEVYFSTCQIVSSCLGCIAHSANDAANAVGPFAAVLTVYNSNSSSSSSSSGSGSREPVSSPWFILLLAGLFMSLGLALWGYRVIRTVGLKLVKITPARGFAMELGAAWTVLVFSALGIPLSTTHCAVGSTVGVGLLEVPQGSSSSSSSSSSRDKRRLRCINLGSVNWKLFGNMVLSWLATIVFSSVVSAALFSFAAYSPRIPV